MSKRNRQQRLILLCRTNTQKKERKKQFFTEKENADFSKQYRKDPMNRQM
jgi:hypothetical protein